MEPNFWRERYGCGEWRGKTAVVLVTSNLRDESVSSTL
jgi:hypothetical protein